MFKKITTILLLAAGLTSKGAVVTGDMRSLVGYGLGNTPVTIKAYDLPQYYNGKLYLSAPQNIKLTNGFLNVELPAPGRYDLSFQYNASTVRIIVPPSSATYDISDMLTNIVVWVQRGISTEVLAGSGIVITTNNAGLPNETITITSTGGSGTASNAYQLQISGAGLSLSTNALAFIYTLSLNANLQTWSAISPSSKQDALGYIPQPSNANLTNWAALATSAKQDHSGNLDLWATVVPNSFQPSSDNLTNWSGIATSAKQNHSSNLDFWSSTAIDNSTLTVSGGILSANTGGGGNVTGDTSSADGEIPVFNGTTGKAIKKSAHLLTEYPTMIQTTQAVLDLTIDIGPLAPLSGINLFAIGVTTNPVPVHVRNNLSLTSDGSGGYYLDAANGAGASALTITNFYVRDTNALILDFAKAQTFDIGMLTNGILIFSNAPAMTNLACHDIQVNLHQWTNGAANLLTLFNSGGKLTTNGTWIQTTNGNVTDMLLCRVDGTKTNIVITAITNYSTYVDTNSLLAAGGGGGGGGNVWFDSFTGTQSTALNGSGGSFMEFDSAISVTSAGTIDQLRVKVDSVVGNASGNFKLAVYNGSGNLVISGAGTLTGAEAQEYKTISVSATSISSGTYTVCFSADVDVNLCSGAAQGAGPSSYANSSGYSGFPPSTLPAPGGNFGHLYLGLHLQ